MKTKRSVVPPGHTGEEPVLSERAPVTERIRTGPSQGTGPLVALLVGLVAIAILKPWNVLAPASSGPDVRGPAISTVAPSLPAVGRRSTPPSPAASLDPNATPCMSANGERLVTLVRTPSQDVRSWQLVDGAIGRDAFQPGLVPVRIPSEHVIGLGLCGVPPAGGTSLPATGELYNVILLDAGAGGFEDLGQPDVLSKGDGRLDAVLYGPPGAFEIGPNGAFLLPGSTPLPSTGTRPIARWAVGSYAAAFRLPMDPAGVVEWVRFNIVAAPGIFG